MSIEDAYFAGIIDGEGCISFYSRKGGRSSGKTHTIAIAVSMTWKPIIEALQKRFGGSIHKRTKPHPQLKQQYSWTVAANLAKKCLEAVAPYLIEKKDQAVLVLEIRDWQISENRRNVRGSKLEAYYEKSIAYDYAMRALKSKEFL